MGYYLNPVACSKEQFLFDKAEKISEPKDLKGFASDEAVVILVDNGFFTAAAFMFNENELKQWQGDRRPNQWFKIKRDVLIEGCPDLTEIVEGSPYPTV